MLKMVLTSFSVATDMNVGYVLTEEQIRTYFSKFGFVLVRVPILWPLDDLFSKLAWM